MSDGYDDSIMVALLPKGETGSKLELPHLTVIYGGEIPEMTARETFDLIGTFISVMDGTPIPPLKVTGLEIFGDDEKVEVLTFASNPELDRLRTIFEPHHKSQYKEFKPHLTMGPVGSVRNKNLPDTVEFNRLILAFGDRKITENL